MCGNTLVSRALWLLWIEPSAHLRVVLNGESLVTISSGPVNDKGLGRGWGHPVERLGPDDADLRFIDFFDWSQFGHIDFQYYRVQIGSSAKHPDLAGHQALVQVLDAKVMVESERCAKPA